jgi:phage shock protein PspC (stress-responsive transcriptional regulator)
MRQIITVSFDNTMFQVEEEAYKALRHYLERVRSGLANDPDVNEVVGDFERSIAEKCARAVRSGKNVIDSQAMNGILEEMGPAGEGANPTPEELTPDSSTVKRHPNRKLYRQPDGAKLSGVCSGLADYFGVDPVFIRIIFIVLSLFGGIGLLSYLILEILMPWPSTYTGRRYKVLKGTLFVGALLTLYYWASNHPYGGRGMLGISAQEILFIPLVMLFYLLPIAVVVLLISLAVVGSVRYLRSTSAGKN